MRAFAIPADATLHGYDTKAASESVQVFTGDESFVQQSMKNEVDINTIVRRYGLTGGLPVGATVGVYADFSGIEDYDSAIAAIERAAVGFMKLPPEIRERFGNDPGQLAAFAAQANEADFVEALKPLDGGKTIVEEVVPPVVKDVVG